MKAIRLKTLLAALALLSPAGCMSSSYRVTFDSYPQGATLICNNQNKGYTPVTLYYAASVRDRESLDVSDCSANWVSGFSQNYSSVSVRQYPEGVRVTLRRPSGPELQQDAEFALKVQQLRAQQQQAAAVEKMADTMEKSRQEEKQAAQSGKKSYSKQAKIQLTKDFPQ